MHRLSTVEQGYDKKISRVECKTLENPNFLGKGKTVISIKKSEISLDLR